MDSKRRMVEMHVWESPHYSELSQVEKLFYWFVICKCDNIGVFEHNPKLAAYYCEGEIDLEGFIEKVNFDKTRIEVIEPRVLWIKNFVRDTWGTIAANNNLGLSCYKLLIKHNLLSRFIAEYPKNINISSFQEAIFNKSKGYANLPLPEEYSLPQCSPTSDPKLTQGKSRPGTINNNISNTINGSSNISNTTPDNHGESALDFEKRSKAFPKHLTGDGVYERMGLGKETGELPFK